jgi:DNA-binding beta-propeller fold protein YncE
VAVSPDGRRLAVVHADGAAVTLVDLRNLAVEETVAIGRPTGFVDRVFGWLPFVPQEAAAKNVASGFARMATFHPDGRHLYVFGYENWKNPSGGEDRRGLGLQLVDLESGEIQAEIPADANFWVVIPSPDGESVYVAGGTPDEVNDTETLVRRFDARTLGPLAERTLDGPHDVLLLTVELRADSTT